jgi:hypothetical protein
MYSIMPHPWTNVQLVLNSRDATGGNKQQSVAGLVLYNNLTFNAENQNIIQGQIHSVQVSEVSFPYDIPNIQLNRTDRFTMSSPAGMVPATVSLDIVVAPGFYDGPALVTAVNAAIAVAGAAVPAPDGPFTPAEMPTLAYDANSNIFTFLAPATPTVGYESWEFKSPFTYPQGLALPANPGLGKDILSLMGFQQTQSNNAAVTNDPPTLENFVAGGSAPLTFTQYVDICSPQLCKFQYFRDGSTTNLSRRSDVICRLFVENSVALPLPVEGVSPFAILRQFYNARVMRWTSDNSIGTMDIQLYDDTGQPLQITWVPRPYQITFNVFEMDKEER